MLRFVRIPSSPLLIKRGQATALQLGPPVALVVHGHRDLDKASNVAAGHQAGKLALLRLDVLLGSVEALLERVLHDVLELLVNLLPAPRQTLAVLAHLQAGNSNTTAVGSLACVCVLAAHISGKSMA